MRRFKAVSSICDAKVINRTSLCSSRQLSTALQRSRISTPTFPCLSLTATRYPNSATTTISQSSRYASSSTPSEALGKTPLYDFHLAHKAKMVPFGGFYMPVSYDSLSVSESHHFTRTHASIFDVSHMVQHTFKGPGATKFLEKITPMDVEGLPKGTGGLSVLLNEKGGIVDDTIVTRLPEDDAFYVVTNAGCREKDLKYLEEQLKEFKGDGGAEVEWNVLDKGLIALQGPESEAILSGLLADGQGDVKDWYFGSIRSVRLKVGSKTSSELWVTRGGYTGEDGFEISIPAEETAAVTQALLDSAGEKRLQLAGLGARDSLRLEAGMCLYGHDLNEDITPVEAGLSWVIGKARRGTSPERSAFNGANTILAQLTPKTKGGEGVDKRRVGLLVTGAPAREGAKIVEKDGGKEIGVVTSGCPSPTLGRGVNIAMGYVEDGVHKVGTEVKVVVRGKGREAVVTKMPFVGSKYYKGGV